VTPGTAPKYVGAGNFGGNGSETHEAAMTGDTVGWGQGMQGPRGSPEALLVAQGTRFS